MSKKPSKNNNASKQSKNRNQYPDVSEVDDKDSKLTKPTIGIPKM